MDESLYHPEVIERINGLAGTAYHLKAKPTRPDQEATLDCWFLHLPGSHPLWDKYTLGLVHLRDLPGVKPAQKAASWVEHEMIMYALDPSLKPDHGDTRTMRHLTPLNYVYQFAGLDDERAIALTARIARMFAAGQLIAEPEGILGARELFRRVIKTEGARIADNERTWSF